MRALPQAFDQKDPVLPSLPSPSLRPQTVRCALIVLIDIVQTAYLGEWDAFPSSGMSTKDVQSHCERREDVTVALQYCSAALLSYSCKYER